MNERKFTEADTRYALAWYLRSCLKFSDRLPTETHIDREVMYSLADWIQARPNGDRRIILITEQLVERDYEPRMIYVPEGKSDPVITLTARYAEDATLGLVPRLDEEAYLLEFLFALRGDA